MPRIYKVEGLLSRLAFPCAAIWVHGVSTLNEAGCVSQARHAAFEGADHFFYKVSRFRAYFDPRRLTEQIVD